MDVYTGKNASQNIIIFVFLSNWFRFYRIQKNKNKKFLRYKIALKLN